MVKRRSGGEGGLGAECFSFFIFIFFFFRRAERTSSLVYKRAVYKRGCHVVKTTAELAAGVGRMEACSSNTRRVLEKRVATLGPTLSLDGNVPEWRITCRDISTLRFS